MLFQIVYVFYILTMLHIVWSSYRTNFHGLPVYIAQAEPLGNIGIKPGVNTHLKLANGQPKQIHLASLFISKRLLWRIL